MLLHFFIREQVETSGNTELLKVYYQVIASEGKGSIAEDGTIQLFLLLCSSYLSVI
jgi:hypothetical protein